CRESYFSAYLTLWFPLLIWWTPLCRMLQIMTRRFTLYAYEQWGYVGAKSRQRWLFYAYDRIRRTVVAHVFGERTLATLERLLSLLSAFEVVVWMTDGWPLYESRLKGKLHVISKRYTQRIERHNLNLRQHLARLGRKSLSFSKSVELHDKVIGHYLNIKHYQ
ncbi:IS1 family transposase, partial [Klebsiella pneumoniae]|uniref:IS1 family transposase n=1 Tax=Klebsiella pneumoniae TaxID=573 RepID=UPI003B9C5E89